MSRLSNIRVTKKPDHCDKPEPITGQVRCSGKLHRISIAPDGPVTLHDHTSTDLAADRIMATLGGDPCRCSQILQSWRDRNPAGLPAWARSELDNSLKKNQLRAYERRGKKDPFCAPIVHRVLTRLRVLISDSMQRCSYRMYKTFPNPRLIGCHMYRTSKECTRIYRSRTGGTHIIVHMDASRWHNHVYRNGLAIVDGVFVLDVLSEDEAGYTVLAGRQNADLSIDTVRARVTVDAAGAKTLQWLDDTVF